MPDTEPFETEPLTAGSSKKASPAMGPPKTIAQILADARQRLASTPFEAPRREAALLLGAVLGLSEAQILARGEEPVAGDHHSRFEHLFERRLQGEPVAYLLGEREFYGRPFHVDSRVLVPRPETEHLVEAILEQDLGESPRILDVGTGSGCLAVTLALELPRARILATDISLGSLLVARRNARRHGVEDRVRLLLLDGLGGLDLATLAVVASNPPYVDPADAAQMSIEVRGYEPHRALFADDGGFAILRHLLDAAASMEPTTTLALEIGFGQLETLRREATARGLTLFRVIDDYAGIPRTVVLGQQH